MAAAGRAELSTPYSQRVELGLGAPGGAAGLDLFVSPSRCRFWCPPERLPPLIVSQFLIAPIFSCVALLVCLAAQTVWVERKFGFSPPGNSSVHTLNTSLTWHRDGLHPRGLAGSGMQLHYEGSTMAPIAMGSACLVGMRPTVGAQGGAAQGGAAPTRSSGARCGLLALRGVAISSGYITQAVAHAPENAHTNQVDEHCGPRLQAGRRQRGRRQRGACGPSCTHIKQSEIGISQSVQMWQLVRHLQIADTNRPLPMCRWPRCCPARRSPPGDPHWRLQLVARSASRADALLM